MKHVYRITYKGKPLTEWTDFDIEPESKDEAIDWAIQEMQDDVRVEVTEWP